MSDNVRPEKVQAVADIKERFETADAVFVTEYAGLSVPEQQALRKGLRSGDAEYKVLKMTLTRLAVADLEMEELEAMLTGPTALAFASGDPVPAAKALSDFADDHDALVIKGLLMAGELLPPEKVSELAKLEPREVLLAKVAGMLQAPMANMAGLMAAFTRNAASMFLQLQEKKEAEGPAESPQPEPTAADEAPAAEAATEESDEPADEAADEAPAAEAAADENDEPADEAADETAETANEEE